MIRFIFKPCLKVRVLKWLFSNEVFKKKVMLNTDDKNNVNRLTPKNKGSFLMLAVIPM